jgi:hypothetical protein
MIRLMKYCTLHKGFRKKNYDEFQEIRVSAFWLSQTLAAQGDV